MTCLNFMWKRNWLVEVQASDIYSFGVLLYELCSGQQAWEGFTFYQIIYRVTVEGRRPEMQQQMPWQLKVRIFTANNQVSNSNLYEFGVHENSACVWKLPSSLFLLVQALMEKCMCNAPDLRPTAQEMVLKLSFMKKLHYLQRSALLAWRRRADTERSSDFMESNIFPTLAFVVYFHSLWNSMLRNKIYHTP